jgi:hypothetical protein
MKLKLLYFCLALTASFSSQAADKDYSICTVAGFYEGDNNRFLTDLAETIAAKNNLFGDEKCSLALKEGKAAGERYSKQVSDRRATDAEIIRKAHNFSTLIYDSILSRVKFTN